jgi:hypothetical protein
MSEKQTIEAVADLLEHIAIRLDAASRAQDWEFIAQASTDLRDLSDKLHKARSASSSSSSSLSVSTPAGGDGTASRAPADQPLVRCTERR